ncbi:Predicted Zn-dependent protease [Pedobacter antarcticus]|nr:Predicted Zn-dependent protease [Pedobacter antarcticus]
MTMKNFIFLVLSVFSSVVCLGQQNHSKNTVPLKAKFITSDIPQFWAAFDSAGRAPLRSREIYDELYFNKGSYGLGIFKTAAIGTTEAFASKIEKYDKYYRSIRRNTLQVQGAIPAMRKSFQRLKELYPASVFPDVYIVMGSMGSGGRSMAEGLFIGADVNCADESSDFTNISPAFSKILKSLTLDKMPTLVTHELIHYQQNYTDTSKNILSRAIAEGSADFVCKLITGTTANHLLHQYGKMHEKELWTQFKNELSSNDIQKWFYYPATDSRPSDLGYYIGYKITEAYYLRSKDKKKAIEEIFNISNFRSFLEKSAYGSKL